MPNPKKIIKAVKAAKKTAQRAETNKIQSNSVKVKSAKDPKRVDNLLKSLPKAPPRTAAEKQRSNKFIEREISKLKDKNNALKFSAKGVVDRNKSLGISKNSKRGK